MFGITVLVGGREYDLLLKYGSKAEAVRWAETHVAPWGLDYFVHKV